MRGVIALVLCLVLSLGAFVSHPGAAADEPAVAAMAHDHGMADAGAEAPCADDRCPDHDHALTCMGGVHCVATLQSPRPSLAVPALVAGERPRFARLLHDGLAPETESPPPKG